MGYWNIVAADKRGLERWSTGLWHERDRPCCYSAGGFVAASRCSGVSALGGYRTGKWVNDESDGGLDGRLRTWGCTGWQRNGAGSVMEDPGLPGGRNPERMLRFQLTSRVSSAVEGPISAAYDAVARGRRRLPAIVRPVRIGAIQRTGLIPEDFQRMSNTPSGVAPCGWLATRSVVTEPCRTTTCSVRRESGARRNGPGFGDRGLRLRHPRRSGGVVASAPAATTLRPSPSLTPVTGKVVRHTPTGGQESDLAPTAIRASLSSSSMIGRVPSSSIDLNGAGTFASPTEPPCAVLEGLMAHVRRARSLNWEFDDFGAVDLEGAERRYRGVQAVRQNSGRAWLAGAPMCSSRPESTPFADAGAQKAARQRRSWPRLRESASRHLPPLGASPETPAVASTDANPIEVSRMMSFMTASAYRGHGPVNKAFGSSGATGPTRLSEGLVHENLI